MKMRENKHGQITIFVILAIVIVGSILLFLLISETGRGLVDKISGVEFDIQGDLIDCINSNENIRESLSEIMTHGGSKNPEFSYSYLGQEYEYLCYTNLYYDTCIMQKPLLIRDVTNELTKTADEEVKICFNELQKKLDNRGYSVSASQANISLQLIPDSLVINIDSSLMASKGDEINKFENFEIRLSTNSYLLIMIANSILNFEARYGEADPMTYMMLYPNIKIEKLKQGDGTTLYFISDRDTKEEFKFAVRSVVLPAGYGF